MILTNPISATGCQGQLSLGHGTSQLGQQFSPGRLLRLLLLRPLLPRPPPQATSAASPQATSKSCFPSDLHWTDLPWIADDRQITWSFLHIQILDCTTYRDRSTMIVQPSNWSLSAMSKFAGLFWKLHRFGSQLVNDLQQIFLNDAHSQKYSKPYKAPPQVSWKNLLISSNLGLPFASLVFTSNIALVLWHCNVPGWQRSQGIVECWIGNKPPNQPTWLEKLLVHSSGSCEETLKVLDSLPFWHISCSHTGQKVKKKTFGETKQGKTVPT